jgi:hypothetical protein
VSQFFLFFLYPLLSHLTLPPTHHIKFTHFEKGILWHERLYVFPWFPAPFSFLKCSSLLDSNKLLGTSHFNVCHSFFRCPRDRQFTRPFFTEEHISDFDIFDQMSAEAPNLITNRGAAYAHLDWPLSPYSIHLHGHVLLQDSQNFLGLRWAIGDSALELVGSEFVRQAFAGCLISPSWPPATLPALLFHFPSFHMTFGGSIFRLRLTTTPSHSHLSLQPAPSLCIDHDGALLSPLSSSRT